MSDKCLTCTDVQRQHENVVVQQIYPTRYGRSDAKKQSKSLAAAINALYNSGGGTLKLHYNEYSAPEDVAIMIRKIEREIHDFLGTITCSRDVSISNIDSSPSQPNGGIEVIVKPSTKSVGMTVLKYNIYLLSNELITEVSPLEGEKLEALLNENIPAMEPIEANAHEINFVKGEHVCFSKSSTIQFKCFSNIPQLKTQIRKTLAYRILNKFPCYVSAFANSRGGYLYFGIEGDGEICGEIVHETEKQRIINIIKNAIDRMIWPEKSKPVHENEDKRWDVYFEPVRDSKNNIIQDLYVVVVFVAQCRGGVFAKEPECYEIFGNKIIKVHFTSWKRKIDLTKKG